MSAAHPRPAVPPELAALRERLAVLEDIDGVGRLLFWDQNTMMPPAGAAIRAERAGTLERIAHEHLTHPELARLLDALAPHEASLDPDSDDARLIAWARRDHERAVRVPADLAAEITRAGALGQQAWREARERGEFRRFRDALARQLELRHRYIACFPSAEHPYDVLLDLFEPGLTTAELRPLLSSLADALVPLVAAAADAGPLAAGSALAGRFPIEAQRAAVLEILRAMGFDEGSWRLDTAPHPFAQGMGEGDVRITTRYDAGDFGVALYSALHEFGHGLYEEGVAPSLRRSPLGEPVSLGVHESQSRLWENLLGRSRPFCAWLVPAVRRALPGALAGVEAETLFRGVNAVRPSTIRVEADETTYNLHIVLRFELEVRLVEGTLEVDDIPAAWDEGMERLLGVEVPGDAEGCLQDVHWGAGLIGYFPTYSLGNLMAAQLWERARTDLPDLDAVIAAGEFAPLREWLRDRIHRHGRKLMAAELLERATGERLRVEPFVRYLRAKLNDADALPAGVS